MCSMRGAGSCWGRWGSGREAEREGVTLQQFTPDLTLRTGDMDASWQPHLRA